VVDARHANGPGPAELNSGGKAQPHPQSGSASAMRTPAAAKRSSRRSPCRRASRRQRRPSWQQLVRLRPAQRACPISSSLGANRRPGLAHTASMPTSAPLPRSLGPCASPRRAVGPR
jgi:hypothetical protein